MSQVKKLEENVPNSPTASIHSQTREEKTEPCFISLLLKFGQFVKN